MSKKICLFVLLVVAACFSFVGCRKHDDDVSDITRNYFPLDLGKYVTFDVDSTYYDDTRCTSTRVKCQLKYVITDTFTDKANFYNKLSYIVDVFYRPYDGAIWKPQSVIILNPTANGLNWTENNVKYIKMRFPISDDFSWKGNVYAPVNDAEFSYLKDWNYQYRNMHKSYNTDFLHFDNTVTVLENDESVNYPTIDSGVNARRTFSKAVYAWEVGLVYREITNWTYRALNSTCVNGYTVVMRAVDHN